MIWMRLLNLEASKYILKKACKAELAIFQICISRNNAVQISLELFLYATAGIMVWCIIGGFVDKIGFNMGP